MEIREITTAGEKRRIARFILESLPDWFGIPEAREEYIEKSAKQPFFAAFDGENTVGFLCLAETGKDTAELCVMGEGTRLFLLAGQDRADGEVPRI